MMEALRKLNQEGQSCFKSGDFPKAVSFFQEAASLALKYGLLQLYATNMNNMAIVYRSMKEFEKAETAYVSILNTLPRGDIHYSQNLTNLADLYCERTDYHKARDYYLQALKIEKGTLFRKKSPDYLHTAFRLAAVYNTLGDYRQAETLFRQILPSIEKELGPQHIGYEAALNGLATVYQGLKNYSKAEPLFQRILAIQEKRVGKDHPEYLKTVSILHQIYSATGQADKALPLTRQVLVAALKNSDLDTFLATLLPKIDAETKEHKALIATVLNETAVQISNEAMRQLKEDTTGEAVEPVKEITRAISFFQKAAEWGCEEAVRNQAKMTNMVCELAATTIEKVTLDPSIVNDVEKAKAAEASGAFDEAIALYGQALEKTSEEHQLTVKLRLASCLKTQAGKNLKAALGRLNNDRNQHQTRINQELDGFFKTHLRKKATLQDGQCVKCAAPAGFKITTADKKDFLLCASHYEDVKAIMNRLPPSTEFMSEALYFADEDLSRADQLIPDNQEIRSLLDQVRQLKPGFPSYTPYSPGSFGNQNARAINPDPPQAGPGPRQDDSVKSRRMEITLDPFPDNMVGVKCDGRHSHAFSRSSLIDVTPAALEEPRIYGEKIYRALFPAGTPAQAGIMSGPDRILLVAPDDLQEIPWEYAFGPEGFVVLNRHFVRGLPPEQRLALPTLDTSLWIVAVPAQPLEEGLEPLNIDGEWSILTESIQGVPYGIWLERTVPPTLDHLREIVANKRNRIVHFMGHGKIIGDDTVLCFENPYGGMEHVKTDYFVQRLKVTRKTVSFSLWTK
ncbi:MAG: tetratricopeptide repeat protein [Desulfobacteraceae bacterium]|nr:tetratricopeptide repeat protein [Desulfobacteraceae bacterium]